MSKRKHIDIKFPKEFAKVCGEHASLFKSEITVLVRTIPLQVSGGAWISFMLVLRHLFGEN